MSDLHCPCHLEENQDKRVNDIQEKVYLGVDWYPEEGKAEDMVGRNQIWLSSHHHGRCPVLR